MERVTSVEWSEFLYPLIRPFRAGSEMIESRRGFFLTIHTDQSSYQSELSPLPGLHHFPLEDAFASANRITRSWVGQSFHELNVSRPVEERGSLAGCLNFCFEGLMFQESSRSLEQTRLWVPGTPIPSLENCERIKVKVGRGTLEQDKQALKELFCGLPEHVLVRVDGNRQLSVVEFRRLISDLPLEKIEYFEEPLDSIRTWFREGFEELPLAVDESLDQYLSGEFPVCHTLVLKPQWVGGLIETHRIAREASEKGIHISLSSCLEGPVGLRKIKSLEEGNKLNWLPSGLGTLSLFA